MFTSHLLAVFRQTSRQSHCYGKPLSELKGRGVGQHEHSHTSYKQCACMYMCVYIYVCVYRFGLFEKK